MKRNIQLRYNGPCLPPHFTLKTRYLRIVMSITVISAIWIMCFEVNQVMSVEYKHTLSRSTFQCAPETYFIAPSSTCILPWIAISIADYSPAHGCHLRMVGSPLLKMDHYKMDHGHLHPTRGSSCRAMNPSYLRPDPAHEYPAAHTLSERLWPDIQDAGAGHSTS